jgi:hypothetical protein
MDRLQIFFRRASGLIDLRKGLKNQSRNDHICAFGWEDGQFVVQCRNSFCKRCARGNINSSANRASNVRS